MAKRKNYATKGQGEICPKCKNVMERREHKNSDNHLKNIKTKQPYYYQEWDYCVACRHLQHYEQYKVWNRTSIANQLQETERQRAFLRSI